MAAPEPRTLMPTATTREPARRDHLVRNRLVGAFFATLVLAPAILPQPAESASASASASRASLAGSARIAVEKASLSTLSVRSSLRAADTLAKDARSKETAWHKAVIGTWVTLQTAPVRSRPAIQKVLKGQAARWQSWVQESRKRNATYLRLVRQNTLTEANFRAKSAKALSTASAVPVKATCRPPANPYAGASKRRVLSSPGMSITQYAKRDHTAMWVTSANLNAPGPRMSAGPLATPFVASRTLLAAQIKSSGALAGVNGDFYSLGYDNSPWGAVINRGGAIVKSTTYLGWKGFVVGANGLASIDSVKVSTVLYQGGHSVRADSLNSHYLPLNGIAVFTPRWGPASGGDLRARQSVREIVVDHRGVIIAIRKSVSRAGIPRGGLVIVAQGSALQRLNAAGFALGKRVRQTSSATSGAGTSIYSTLGVGVQILKDGINLTCANDRPVARSAVGIKPGGREIVLVTVRGQTDSAKAQFSGMSVREMAVFMRSLGVYNAAMFDGGGSTILMAKIGSQYQQFLGAPRYIRPVSNSLGIWRG